MRKKANSRVVLMCVVLVLVMSFGAIFAGCLPTSKITLDFDGGTLDGQSSMVVKAPTGRNLDLTQYKPTKSGYFVSAWTDGSKNYVGSYPVTGKATLRPVWRPSDEKTVLNMVDVMLSSLEVGQSYSFEFEGQGTDSAGVVTKLALKAHIESKQKYTIAFTLSDVENTRSLALYIKDNVFYIYTPETGGIALSDFDLNYLLDAITKVPELAGNLIGNVNLGNLSIDSVLNLVFQMFVKTQVNEYDDALGYQFNINPIGLKSILKIVNLINLDGILAQAGLNLKVGVLLDWFVGVLPDIDIVLNLKTDKITQKAISLDCSATSKDEKVFEFSTSKFDVIENGVIIDIVPDEIKNYVPYSLGNLDLSVDLSLSSGNGDLGKLLNALTNTKAFVENTLILKAGVTYRLNIKTSLDIGQRTEGDQNLIALGIQEVLSDGTTKDYINVYYKEGYLYINLADTLQGIYAGKGIKIGLSLDNVIANLKQTIRAGIDKVFGTENGKVNANTLATGSVVALSQEQDGFYISDGLHNFMRVVLGVLGVDGNNIQVENGTQESGSYSIVKLNIDKKFLTSFLSAIGQKGISIPDFGKLGVELKLGDGLEYISIDANLTGDIDAKVMLDDIAIGTMPKVEDYASFSEYIDSKIGDTSKYTYSVKELVEGVLGGSELGVDIKLQIAKGKYNLADILALFGVQGLQNNALVWNLTSDTVLDARLQAKLATDSATGNLQGYVELILNSDFAVGSEVLAKQGVLAGVYLDKQGQGYIDLSGMSLFGIDLPAMKVNVDTSSLMQLILDKVDTNLVFDTSSMSASELALANADQSTAPLSASSLLSGKGSEIVLSSTGFSAVVTLSAIQSMLTAFGLDLVLPESLEAEIGLELNGQGFAADIQLGLKNASTVTDTETGTQTQYDTLKASIELGIAKEDILIADTSVGEGIDEYILSKTSSITDAQSNIIKALMTYVGNMSLDLGIEFSVEDSQQLGEYIKNLVSKWLPDVDWNLNIDSMAADMALRLDRTNQRYAFELSTKDAQGKSQYLIYVGANGDDIIIDINNIGTYALRDTGFVTSITTIVDKAMDSLEGMDLNKIIADLLNGNNTQGDNGNSDSTQSSDGESSGQDNTQTGQNQGMTVDEATMQKILSLLNGVYVEDLTINFDFSQEMIAQVLALVDIDVDFLSANGNIAIADGTAEVGIVLGENAIKLNAYLGISKTDSENLDYTIAVNMLRAYKDAYVPQETDAYEHLRTYLEGKLTELGKFDESMQGQDLSVLAKAYTDTLDKEALIYFANVQEVKDYALKLLEGIDFSMNFSLNFSEGQYNIIELIGKFVDLSSLGLDENASLILSFGQPGIDLSIRLQSAIVKDSTGKLNTAMQLALVANKDLSFGIAQTGGDKQVILEQGQSLLGLYVYDNSLYIDASALRLLGLSMPIFKADKFELGTFLYQAVENIVDKVFEFGNSLGFGESGSSVAMAQQGLQNSVENGENTDGTQATDSISVTIQSGKLNLALGLGVISTLLSNFLTGSQQNIVDILDKFADIQIEADFSTYEGESKKEFLLGLNISGDILSKTDGSPSNMSIDIDADSKDIKLGDSTMYESLSALLKEKVDGYDKTYSDLVQGIAERLMTGSLVVDVNMNFAEGKYLLNELINSVIRLATGNEGISVPISIDTSSFSKNVQIALQWSMNPNTQALTFMLEVRSENSVLLGVYLHKGELMVDAVGLGLVRINLTDLAIVEDLTQKLTSTIGSLKGLDLNELLGKLFGDNTQNTQASGIAISAVAMADESTQPTPDQDTTSTWLGELLGALMLENTNIKLALSAMLLQDIIYALTGKELVLDQNLFDINVNLGIIDGKIDIDAYLLGDKESALISMSVDASLSNDKIVSDAYIPSRFALESYTVNATNSYTLLKDILDKVVDIELSTNLSLQFNAGTYNIAELLANFGLTQMQGTQLLWTFNQDTQIKLVLDAKIKTNSQDKLANMVAIELKADGDILIGSDKVMDDGTVVLGIYSYQGRVYVDASQISVLGFDMPIFNIDYDLVGTLIEKLMTSLNPDMENVASITSADGTTTYLQALGNTDSESASVQEGDGISIGINQNEIIVALSLQAIMQILKDFGVSVAFDISSLDLTPMIRVGEGIHISLDGELLGNVNGGKSDFGIAIDMNEDNVKFGIDTAQLSAYLEGKAQEYSKYNDDLINTLKGVFGKNSIRLGIDFSAQAGSVDIISLISGLINKSGLGLNFPINLNFDNLNYDFEMLFNWDIETRSILFELNMVGSVNTKTLLGLYGSYDDLYLSLEGVGLVNIKAQGSKLVSDIFDKLDTALGSINPIILSDILAQIFESNQGTEIVPPQTGTTDSEVSPELADAEAQTKSTQDLLRYLISSIRLEDSKIFADLTSTIVKQIFMALGIETDIVLEAGINTQLASNEIGGYINFDSSANFDLRLQILGESQEYLPSDTSRYVVLDLTKEDVQGRDIVKQFLDGYNFAFTLDLKSNTVGTAVDSSQAPNQYTRLYIEKISGTRQLDNHSATVGANNTSGVLISLYDINESEYMSHGSGTKTAMLHFYLDYANSKGTVYLCPGYFKIAIRAIIQVDIDLASYLSSQAIDNLDILSMLAPIADNLLNSMKNANEDIANGETSDSTGNVVDGSTEAQEPTGFAKVFADLDINELLRQGITLNVMSTGLVNVNIKLDAYVFNKMIDDLMGCLFGADTAIDLRDFKSNGQSLFTSNYLEYMWWDRLAMSNLGTSAAAGGTPYSVWDSIVKQLTPIISDAIRTLNIKVGNITLTPSTVNTFLDLVRTSQHLHGIVKRLLPIATFNTAELNLNLIEGTIANISFKGEDTGAKIVKYEQNSSGQWQATDQVLSYTVKSRYAISNNYDSSTGVYSYTYYYNDYDSINTYVYGGKGIMYRTGFYYNADRKTYGVADTLFSNEIQVYNMSPSVGDESLSPNGTSGIVDWGSLATDITFNPYMYSSANSYDGAASEYWNRYFASIKQAVYQKGTSIKRGTITLKYNNQTFTKDTLKTLFNKAGTHTIVAQANFYDGSISTINIKLNVLNVWSGGFDAVRSVEPISLHIYESIPDYVVVNTYGGEQVKYFVDGKEVSLTGNYEATSPTGGEKTAMLTFANGSQYPVQINYMDSTISAQSTELDWYDLDFTGKDDAVKRQEIIDKLLDMFPLQYDDGTFVPQLLLDNITWDLSQLDALIDRTTTNLAGVSYVITITFDKKIGVDGKTIEAVDENLVQKVELTINLKDKTKTSVLLDGETKADTLTINPYEYYMYLMTGDEVYNPLPGKAVAEYVGGESEEIDITLEFIGEDIDFGYIDNSTSKGEQVSVMLSQNASKYNGKGYFDEKYSKINAYINENIITKIYFDEQKTKDYITIGESYDSAYIVFANGLELKMPVHIKQNGDKALVYIGFDVEIYNQYGKLSEIAGLNGSLLQAFSVQVR